MRYQYFYCSRGSEYLVLHWWASHTKWLKSKVTRVDSTHLLSFLSGKVHFHFSSVGLIFSVLFAYYWITCNRRQTLSDFTVTSPPHLCKTEFTSWEHQARGVRVPPSMIFITTDVSADPGRCESGSTSHSKAEQTAQTSNRFKPKFQSHIWKHSSVEVLQREKHIWFVLWVCLCFHHRDQQSVTSFLSWDPWYV